MMPLSRRFIILAGWLLASLTVWACSESNPTTPSTTCSFTVGQPSVTAFPPEGGTGTAAVTTTSTCAWTATSAASFISITQGASGTGNGTVQFTVAANPSTADRTGALTIAGSTVNLTQRAATSAPAPILSTPTANAPTGGQTVSSPRPTLVVNNSTATGITGAPMYHFEVSDLDTFPSDPARTFAADVPEGAGGTTSWALTRDLAPNVLWFWRAQAFVSGVVTSAFSNVETFRTAAGCSYNVSPATVSAPANGGSFTVTVATDSACAWTASSQSTFITVTSGASGTGNGSVVFTVAAATGTSRTGTLTIAGRSVTVTQQGTNISASFRLLDPGRSGTTPTTECQIRSLTSVPTQCTLESTSFPTGTNSITNYSWVVAYIYPNEKVVTQTGINPRFSFTEVCGLTGSNDSGLLIELKVTLTVTDSEGNSVTVRSNAGSQPLLSLRAYLCGI